jgi:hypothetical protein
MNRWPLLLATALLSTTALAETPEEKGLRLAKEADARDAGFGDYVADMKMVLRNRAGDESVRQIRISILEVAGDGDKSLSLFDEPADVKGTAMLKRIASRNKSGPFMGSEFAYEDLGSQEIEKYTYKHLGDEACGDGWQCWVIERTPAYEYSGYSRQVVWMEKDHYRLVKADFYDRKGDLLKTLDWSGYEEYAGRHWRPAKMFMQNHQTGKSTLLEWSNYRFKTGLDDGDFNKNALARLR